MVEGSGKSVENMRRRHAFHERQKGRSETEDQERPKLTLDRRHDFRYIANVNPSKLPIRRKGGDAHE